MTFEDHRRLLDGIRALDRARSLTDVLDALAAGARLESSFRVAVLLARGDGLAVWRLAGFEAAPDLALAKDAVSSRELVAADRRVAAPLLVGGDPVAVLYVDGGTSSGSNPESRTPNSDVIEILSRYAARCLEALTAMTAARALTEAPEAVAPSAVRRDDDEDHVAARRYARLLVSEIKLYHEGDVLSGRRHGDLSVRLGGEISRARALYEQRVPATVRQRADYFQAEVIRTLADGDKGLVEAVLSAK